MHAPTAVIAEDQDFHLAVGGVPDTGLDDDEIASGDQSRVEEYNKLAKRVEKLREDIYGKLKPFQRVQLSRHFDRPFTLDFIHYIVDDFIELHGDRLFGDDAAIVGGMIVATSSAAAHLMKSQPGRSALKAVLRATPGSTQAAASARIVQNLVRGLEEGGNE